MVNLRLLKQAVEASGVDPGAGPLTFPEDHQALMPVPKGGSSCSNCEYVDAENHSCRSEHYQKWNGGSGKLPDRDLDSLCSDWWKAAKPLDEE